MYSELDTSLLNLGNRNRTGAEAPVPFRSYQGSEVGFPIRKSTDQSLFAAPHGLSQRITSFIACACQGIHQMPLRHLIVLIAHDHQFPFSREERDDHERFILFMSPSNTGPRATGDGVLRKGLCQSRPG